MSHSHSQAVLRLLRLSTAGLAVAAGAAAAAGLAYDDALDLATDSPAVSARHAALAGANSARRAAGQLPDPRLMVAIENVPTSGDARYSLSRDSMTMRRIGIEQDMPTGDKREAQRARAAALEWRERAALSREKLRARHEAGVAWVTRYYAERRLEVLDALERENRLLLETLPARVAAGTALPEQSAMARQEQAALADRRDEIERERRMATAALRRWIGEAAGQPLEGTPPEDPIDARQLRDNLARAPELSRFPAELAMAEAELQEAQAERRGDWRWGVSYAQRGKAYENMVSVQIGIDLPLRREQRQLPLLRAREQERARVVAEQQDAEREVRASLESRLAELDDVTRRIGRLRATALPLADERVRLATAAYATPRGALGDVLAARRERVELHWRAIELEAQRAQLRIALHHQLLPTQP
jgi:cobalt-zinc-cadmium efflux system outer membrane protein